MNWNLIAAKTIVGCFRSEATLKHSETVLNFKMGHMSTIIFEFRARNLNMIFVKNDFCGNNAPKFEKEKKR